MAYRQNSGTMASMDLSLPLRTLAPSLDSDVLAVLAGTESSLGATQVARLAARGSRQGVSVVLDRLVDHGLVLAQPTNKGYSYSLNRDHLLVPPLIAVLDMRRRVLDLLTELVRDLQPEPLHVGVFGSFARGDAGPQSDIDLLVVIAPDRDRHDERWVAQLREASDRALAATGNRLEPLVVTAASLRESRAIEEPLVGALLSESIRLAGKPLTAVLDGSVLSR